MVEDFSDGLAHVTVNDKAQPFGHSAIYLDSAGKVVARAPVFLAQDFSEGLAAYEVEGKPGLRSFQPGVFFYRDYPGLKGYIDRTGKVVIQPVFAGVGPFVDGLARAVLDGYCHSATPDGDRQGTPTSGYPTSCGGAPDDAVFPCAVGFIDRTGNFAIRPRFESARVFWSG